MGFTCVDLMRYFLLLTAFITSVCWSSSSEAAFEISPATQELIWDVAREEQVDPYLLQSIVAIESAYNTRSISKKGAVGLMQLMPGTARDLGVTNRFNPEQNLRGGARYIKRMIDRFSDVRLALAAYNAGPANVARHKGIPPFAETIDYIGSVMRNYAKINPGSNSNPKRIYRFTKPNGTVVLTDKRRVFAMAMAYKDRNSKNGSLKRTPFLSIKRHIIKSRPLSQLAPYVAAKPRLKLARKSAMDSENGRFPLPPTIIRAKMRVKATGKTVAVITNRPIVQLTALTPLRKTAPKTSSSKFGKIEKVEKLINTIPATSVKPRLKPIIQARAKIDVVPVILLSRQ